MRLTLLLLISFLASCGESTSDPSFTPAAYDKRTAQAVVVRWLVVDDVSAECLRRGSSDAGAGRVIASCAQKAHDGSICTIVTGKSVKYAHFGHELRHCFEPVWEGHL